MPSGTTYFQNIYAESDTTSVSLSNTLDGQIYDELSTPLHGSLSSHYIEEDELDLTEHLNDFTEHLIKSTQSIVSTISKLLIDNTDIDDRMPIGLMTLRDETELTISVEKAPLVVEESGTHNINYTQNKSIETPEEVIENSVELQTEQQEETQRCKVEIENKNETEIEPEADIPLLIDIDVDLDAKLNQIQALEIEELQESQKLLETTGDFDTTEYTDTIEFIHPDSKLLPPELETLHIHHETRSKNTSTQKLFTPFNQTGGSIHFSPIVPVPQAQ